MSQTLSRCANVQLSVNLSKFECTDDIMGNFGNLTDFGRGLGSIPGQLGSIVDCVTEDLRAQIEKALKTYTDTIRAVLKAVNVSVPDPIFSTIEVPEFEFELRVRALWTDFKLYLYQKLIDLLSKIPGLEAILKLLKVPIPFLKGVYLIDVFTAEGRARIAKAVDDQLDAVEEALGMPWDSTFTGKLTLKSKDFAKQNILNRIYTELGKMLSKIVWNALNFLTKITKPIRELWEKLGFPLLPAFFELDFDKLFTSIYEGVVAEFDNVVDRMNAMIDRILNVNVFDLLKKIPGLAPLLKAIDKLWTFGKTVREILKPSETEWNLTLPEINFSRTMQAVKDLFDRIPTIIFELWLKLIKDFLKAITELFRPIKAIINELLTYIPFTFCSFINLAAKPILSMGSLVRDILPPGITINTVNPSPLLT